MTINFFNIINNIDLTLMNVINRPINPVINSLALLSIYLMYFVIMLVFYYLYFEKKWKLLKRYVSSAIFGFATVYILKYLIRRPRPNIFPLVVKVDPSFPSTHAFFSGFLLYVSRHEKIPSYLKIISLIFSVLIPFVKMYIGVHYPTDILVGFVLGYLFPGVFYDKIFSKTSLFELKGAIKNKQNK